MSATRRAIRRAALLVLALAVAGRAQRPAATSAQEWRTYDNDLAGTRFSLLTDINAGNVSRLAKAWTYTLPSPPGRGGPLGLGAPEAVPLVVAGVMYLPAGSSVVALEADTGRVIWQREIGGGPQAGSLSRRGVGYWPATARRRRECSSPPAGASWRSMRPPARARKGSARTAKST